MRKSEVLPNGNIKITIPFVLHVHGGRTHIIQPDRPAENENSGISPVLLNLARGYRWQEMIDNGRFPNIRELAETIGIDSGVVAKAIRLTLLSPKIVHLIVTGEIELTMKELRESFPVLWEEQEKLFMNLNP